MLTGKILKKIDSLKMNNPKGALLFKKVFKQYIEQKISNEYEEYFKAVIKEAS